MTAAKESIIEKSGHPLHRYISEAVASGHFLITLGLEFTLDELQRQLNRDGYGAHAKNMKELSAALREANVESVRISKNGERKRAYRLPPSDEDNSAGSPLEF
jgi:hypothetical protein